MKIQQFKPFTGTEEYENIKQCFDKNWITEGPLAKKFTDKLLSLLNVKYGVLAPNGTLSLYMSLLALGIKKGDEVLVPNFTFVATANAVIMTGAKPVFVDISEEDLHLDINKLEKQITKRTKAIMPVHIYGMACDMDSILRIAKKYKLFVVEDAAQGIGVKWKDKSVGTYGDLGSFSFFADKTITTGEGGFICTNSEELYTKLLYIRNQGRINRGSFIHPHIGFNFRMTDIQCAIGLTQLKKLDFILNDKKRILETYKEGLNNNIRILEPKKDSNHVPFRVSIILNENNEKLIDYMKDKEIETRTFFYPLNQQPCFSQINKKSFTFFRRKHDEFKTSNLMYLRGVCLPSYVGIEREKILFICNSINSFYV